MSKIRAFRLININYNDNTIHISDETMYLNGETTLINLDNGGGKSVLVQLLMAPFVQKRYRSLGKREFESYFHADSPSFILVEWEKENGAGYLTAGFMGRRSSGENKEERLDLIAIISEYRENCPLDIVHLPLVRREEGRVILESFGKCREMFEGFKREKKNDFFCYDMTQSAQSRQYFERLASYGINHREWAEIIRRINAGESGLSFLFNDCREEKDLVEKWFIDIVEKFLNRDKDRMKEFRTILKKYIELYRDNRERIQKRAAISSFDAEAEKIKLKGEAYQAASKEEEEAAAAIGDYIFELDRIGEKNAGEIENRMSVLDEAARDYHRLCIARCSAAFYLQENLIMHLRSEKEELEKKCSDSSWQRAEITESIHLYEAAEQQERVDEAYRDFSMRDAALARARRSEADLIPEREYLGWLLKGFYQENLEVLTVKSSNEQVLLRAAREAEREAQDNLKRITAEREDCLVKLGGLKAMIEGYSREEQRFNEAFGESLARNIVGEYDAGAMDLLIRRLGGEEKALDDILGNAGKRLTQAGQEETLFSHKETETAVKERSLLGEKEAASKIREDYEAELGVRRTILRYLELPENVLFDTERIFQALAGKIAQIEAIVRSLTSQVAAGERELEAMKEGRGVPLSKELETFIEDQGIHLVYGMAWIRYNLSGPEEIEALLKRHPFLPYALVMSEAELKKLGKTLGETATDLPVPIVTRESLAREMEEADGLPSAGSARFYLYSQRELLCEESLAQFLKKKEEALNLKKEALATRSREYQEYVERGQVLREQRVSEHACREMELRIEGLTEEMAKVQKEYQEIRAKLADLKEEKAALTEQIRSDQDRHEKLLRELSEARDLEDKYREYLENNKSLDTLTGRLNQLKQKERENQEAVQASREAIEASKKALSVLERLLEEERTRLRSFEAYAEREKPEGLEPGLEKDEVLAKARFQALSQDVSGDIRQMEEDREKDLARLDREKERLERLCSRYEFAGTPWKDITFSEEKKSRLDAELSRIEEEIRSLEEQRNKKEIALALEQQKEDQVLTEMRDSFGQSEPLPKNEVPDVDYAKAIALKENEKESAEKAVRMLEKRQEILEQNRNALSEYADLPRGRARKWTEDFSSLGRSALADFTASLKKNLLDKKASRERLYTNLRYAIEEVLRMDAFQEEFFKRPLGGLLRMSEDASAGQVLDQLAMIRQGYHDLVEKLLADISIVEDEKESIVSIMHSYVRDIHEQMGRIDKNSSITVRNRPIRMLKILQPEWQGNEALYRSRVGDYVDSLTSAGLETAEKGGNLEDYLGKALTTRELYDTVIGVRMVRVKLYKIEQNREVPISWDDVMKNSGGEGFLSSFVILSSLLYYMRRDGRAFSNENEGKVLLMDNPFASTNAAHLLIPMFDLAKKNNTQLICLTGLEGESIFDRFDNIYTLNLIPSTTGEVKYMKMEHTRGQEIASARLEVKDSMEQLELEDFWQ